MASEHDIAWAAGIFEGEGSCSLSSDQGQPRVSVQMTDEDVVRRFAAVMGCGDVRTYSAYQPNRQRQWQWSVQSRDDVLHVLGLLWPHLGERRRERATEVIERAAKMHDGVGFCKRGHDLSDPRHVYLHEKTGKRHCRTCRLAYSRKRWLPRLAN